MSLNENLAVAMRAYMRAKHMSLAEFAAELQVSRTALQDYIKARGNPSTATIVHIAQRMGVHPGSLMAGLLDVDEREIALLLLDTLHGVAELPENKRIEAAEHFLAMVRLWNEKIEALRFRQPMPVRELARYRSGEIFPVCPQCGSAMEREYQNFCDRCGQRLSWRQLSHALVVNR